MCRLCGSYTPTKNVVVYRYFHKLQIPNTLEKWNFISPSHGSEDCLRFTDFFFFFIYWMWNKKQGHVQQAWEKDVKVNTIIKTCTLIKSTWTGAGSLSTDYERDKSAQTYSSCREFFFFCFFIRLVYQKLIKIFSVGAGRDVVELNNLLHRNMMSRNLTRRIMWNIKIKTNQLFFHQWQELSGVIKCISIHSRTTTSQYTVQYQRVLACHLMLPWRTIDDDDDEKRVVEEDDDDEDSVKRILIIR